jgi:hypothetical protein
MFFEMSAKTAYNVNKMFFNVIACLPFFDNLGKRKDIIDELGKLLL